jgi:hypothetical protein
VATLNGVEFGIVHITKTIVHDNNIKDIPGSDTVVQDDLGYSTAPMRITGHVKNDTEYDDLKEQYYSGGELTLIVDPDSGKQYTVYAHQNLTDLDGDRTYPLTDIVFQAMFFMKNPYLESVTDKTRIKSITTNNQEWSADNDGNPLKTDGNVDAVPDIQITGSTTHAGITQTSSDSNYNTNNSAAPVTISHTGTANFLTMDSGQPLGQTVNCRKAGMAIIDSIQMNVEAVVTGGDVTCTVYSGVGGASLGSKVVNVAGVGVKTFTFTTPIAVVQEEETCADSTDTNKIYFKFSCTGSTHMNLDAQVAGYADGRAYVSDSPSGSNEDLYFVVAGHSCKEIRQTFTVPETYTLSHLILNLCKYQYGGSNVVTVIVKEGGTTLGTGTATLSGSTFTDVDFYLDEETAHSLELSAGTTYTLSITPPSDSGNATAVLIKTKTSSVYANGAVTLVEDGGTTRAQTHDIYFKLYFAHSNEDIQIYNTTDTTVKCDVANQILEGAIHRINIDGTGTIDFDDDFTTGKYATTNEGMSGITHDTGNDELDIADDGYIYWKKDTKFPIDGIPTLTARINITSGTPTIQISTDASTWYDIDTAIADDVETVYPLDSDGNLSLAGKTVFYWRFDCVKAAPATASIKSFELDIDIHTIYAKNPVITKGATASTFRCDQDADSGMACEVKLIYPDRWWA